MRPIEHFLTDLGGLEITLRRKGDRLVVQAPSGAMTPGLAAKIRANKTEILDFLDKVGQPQDTIPQAAPNAEPLMSHSQRRLWFLDRFEAESDTATSTYHIYAGLNLEGELKVASLQKAIARLVKRHAGLRTNFCERGGKPLQIIHADTAIELIQVDMRDQPEPAVTAYLASQTAQPFDLEHDPLLRMVLVKLGDQRHILQIVMHHIISDGWSMGVFVRELIGFYREAADGIGFFLPDLAIQYHDYAIWQHQPEVAATIASQLEWWRSNLTNLPGMHQLTTDLPRPRVQTHRGAVHHFRIGQPVHARLNRLAKDRGATLFMVLLAGFKALVARYSGQDDIAVGSPVANRNRGEIEPLIGFFVNTLVMRTYVDLTTGFSQLLEAVRKTTLGAFAHQEVPFERVVEAVKPERSLSHSPLFQLMFSLQTYQAPNLDIPGLHVTLRPSTVTTAKFDLTLDITPSEDGLHCSLEYNTDLFLPETITAMARHLETLLDHAGRQPDRPLRDLPLMTAEEETALGSLYAVTPASYSLDQPVHGPFEAVASAFPNRKALVFEGGTGEMTYAELNARANRIAWRLLDIGIGPEDRVAFLMARAPEMVAGVLAVLKVGGAYVPLDPNLPRARLETMLTQADARLILTQRELRHLAGDRPSLCLDSDEGYDAQEHNPEVPVQPLQAAYLIFTSGSTGQPKASVNTHRGLSNHNQWIQQQFPVGEGDRVALKTPFSFDVWAKECLWPLSFGATVALARPGTEGDPFYLRDWIVRERITVVYFVASMMRAFLDSLGKDTYRTDLRYLFCGGEALKPAVQRLALEKLHGEDGTLTIQNTYGPSETAITCMFHPCGTSPQHRPIPLGNPITNMGCFTVDQALRLTPRGIPGELAIAGANLGRGYLHRPGQTASRFVPNPFSKDTPGDRLYLTGDRVRIDNDGKMAFLGRNDHQLKLRGIRIELGDIEGQLLKLTGVEAAVAVVGSGKSGAPTLAAFIQGEPVLTPGTSVRDWLAQQLPAAMVPATITIVDTWPRLSSGKIDRASLSQRVAKLDIERQPPVPPRNPLETEIAEIWQEVLGLVHLGIHDHFFELGGHSLMATQIISRLRLKYDVEMPLKQFFANPTIAAIAHWITSKGEGDDVLPALLPVDRGDVPPALSFAQQRLWFLDRMLAGKARQRGAYHIHAAMEMKGHLDQAALNFALQQMGRRHESLRTQFREQDGKPVQIILPTPELALGVSTLESTDEGAIQEAIAAEIQMPFDLATDPLLRLAVLPLASDRHILVLTMHHIISDGWSMGILVRELLALYRQGSGGPTADLPALPIQYADFAIWQRRPEVLAAIERQADWWASALAGLPAVHQLPTDRPRPAVQTYRGARLQKTIEPRIAEAVKQLADESGATMFMVLLAAFKLLLARYSGESDTVVGSPVANRNRAEIEPLIGFFANTLIFRDALDGQHTFPRFLDQVKANALACYANQDVPFEQIVERMKPERSLSHAPLFQIMFSMQNAARADLDWKDLKLAPLQTRATASKFDLTLDAGTNAEGLQIAWEYNTDLFDEATIATMSDHFSRLLGAITTHPDTAMAALDLMDRPTRMALIRDYNDTATSAFEVGPVHGFFEAMAAAHPDRVAILADDLSPIDYAELNRRANRLAWRLQEAGVVRETRVALLAERSLEMVVGLLAVLKAGGAYVPLDPQSPADRIEAMLRDSGASLVLRSAPIEPPSTKIPMLVLDDQGSHAERDDNLNLAIDLDQAAYLIYTSGSTGTPKASINTHRGLANHNLWLQHRFPLDPGDRMAVKTPLHFDVSAWETLWPLMVGAGLVIAKPGTHGDPFYLQNWIREKEITCIYFVASMLQSFLDSLPGPVFETKLRLLFTGGEAIKPDIINLAGKKLKGQSGAVVVVNTYGPSEAAISCTSHAVGSLPRQQPIPIGKPIDNMRAYVIDAPLRLQPPGIPGELLIGGANLSRGYQGRPSLTAAKFVPDPFATGAGGQRLYRTGDRVRMRDDGALLFLGRIDGQVKLRGLRIELGEIETHLDRHLLIQSSQVVVTRQTGTELLVAYVQPAEAGGDVNAADLRAWLAERLPNYMVPAAFVAVEAWPRLSNGKIDRGNLARRPVRFGREDAASAEPKTLMEKNLAEIWCEVLDLDTVGRHDNFFHLGGHSLLATQVISRIREVFQAEIPLQDLFAEPTIAALARWIASASSQAKLPPLTRRPNRDAPPPLSFAQQRMWFLDQFSDPEEASLGSYHLHTALEVSGQLDGEALQRALDRMGLRHEALRTHFRETGGKPVQIIDEAPHLEIRQMRVPDLEAGEMQKLIAVEAGRHFDLANDPLLRLTLIERTDAKPILLFTMHHIISDGWSMGIFVQELVALYREEIGQAPADLSELTLQYADFSTWQQKEVVLGELDRQAQWWQAQLADLPLVHQLQTDRARPAIQTHHGQTLVETVPQATMARLQHLAKETGTTLFMVLLAGFKTLLARHSGQRDIVVGTPIANRNRREIEPLIGFFVNTLVLRARVEADLSYLDLLQQVKTTTLGAYAHQDVPFEQVVDLLKPERHLSHSPLFQIMFSLQNAPMGRFELPELAFEPLEAQVQAAKFDITLDTEAREDGLVTSWNFNTDLFDRETIATMAGHYRHLLETIAGDPAQTIGELDLLGSQERHKLLAAFNQTAKAFPLDRPIHSHIESHAQHHPTRVAVHLGDGEMSYDALNRRANRIAWKLIERGIGPGARVALFLDRCGDMIAAIVGILKAGAAYLPIDPEYPETRIAFMLEDGDPDLVLTQAAIAEDLGGVAVLRLDRDEAYADRDDNPGVAVDCLACAYMIYTSGSTGRPKASLNSHRGLSNHIHWLQDRFSLTPDDRLALKTPFSFDVSARETFWPLVAGASLVIAAPGTSGDPYYLQDWIRDKGITVCYFVASMLQTFLESLEGETYHSKLRLLFTGGETLPPESQRQILDQMIGQNGPLETQVTYGPSEAAISCTHHPCGLDPRFDQLPIGKPIPNMAAYVVDPSLQPMPLGVPGELMIAGENLSHGYHRRPGLTASRFLPNPFGGKTGDRLYRTGDLVRYKPDGNILFIGRIDGQIKLRGMRIELGEIERRLAEHDAVAKALVMLAKNPGGEPMLLAFYQFKDKEPEDLARTLWGFLVDSLPAYMVPGKFVGLAEWPRLPNGKIDRHALQDLAFGQAELGELQKAERVAPRTPVESALAEIWCEVLGLETVGVLDNFFEVGGHSLLATQVLARMREAFPERLSLRYLFAEPTIAGIAAGIENIRKSTSRQVETDDDSRETLAF